MYDKMKTSKTLYEFSSSPQAVHGQRRLKKCQEQVQQSAKQRKKYRSERRVVSNTYSETSIKRLLEQSRRIPIDISANLVEQVKPSELKNIECQTAEFLQRSQTPPYVPKKTGMDRGTQIEDDDELFNFDLEVDPILDVIVSKTLEQSLFEVRQEEEAAYLAKTKQYYLGEREKLREQQLQREMVEIEKFKEKEALKKRETERLNRELIVCQKTAALAFFKGQIGQHLEKRVFRHLGEIEHFRDEQRDAILYSFLPWLEDEVVRAAEKEATAVRMTEALIKAALNRRRETALKYRREIQERKQMELDREAERLRLEELKRNTIQIYLRGEGLFEDVVGPIPLNLKDTVAAAEENIQRWIVNNLENGEEIDKPEGGFLSLVLKLQNDEGDGERTTQIDDQQTLEFLTFANDCVVSADATEEEQQNNEEE